MKYLFILAVILIGCGPPAHNRSLDINSYSGMIVIKQECGYSRSYYILQNPATKEMIEVEVKDSWCDVYQKGDTIGGAIKTTYDDIY